MYTVAIEPTKKGPTRYVSKDARGTPCLVKKLSAALWYSKSDAEALAEGLRRGGLDASVVPMPNPVLA